MDTLTCPNCQQQIVPINGGFTPHFDQAAQTFSCTKDPRVINPLSGELAPVEDAPTAAQEQNVTQAKGVVANPA